MTGIASYLLPLPVFHAAGPGALDKVFGPDGDFAGAPKFQPPLFGNYQGVEGYYPLFHLTVRGVPLYRDARGYADPIENAAFDLRVPSVAARLLALLCRAIRPKLHLHSWQTAADLAARVSRGEWNDDYAARTVELAVAFAAHIAALP